MDGMGDGRKVPERRAITHIHAHTHIHTHTYILMADSFCFIAKTNTTLQSNYTPIKNK